jgi:hypothetical protein
MRRFERRLARLEALLPPLPAPREAPPELVAALKRLFLPEDGRVNRVALFGECVQFLAGAGGAVEEGQAAGWRQRFDRLDDSQVERLAGAMLSRYAPEPPPHPHIGPITDDDLREGLRRLLGE